jgi:hypothetical protein
MVIFANLLQLSTIILFKMLDDNIQPLTFALPNQINEGQIKNYSALVDEKNWG